MKNIKKPLRDLLGTVAVVLASLTLSAVCSATVLTTVTVDATTPFSSWLDTGLTLSPGDTYDFTVNDPATIWSAGSNSPYSRDSTANGIDPVASGYGTYTANGFTANYGALVGDAGGTLFLIGTGTTATGLSGKLTVGYWDSIYGDNSGTQSLTVASVPEPSTYAMLLLGLGAIGVGARRKIAVAATRGLTRR